MINVRTETTYSVGEGLPSYSHLPYGTKGYDSLWEYHSLDRLEDLCRNEIASIEYALDKYDSPYEPEHKKMCSDMKQIKAYLEVCLKEIHDLVTPYKQGG